MVTWQCTSCPFFHFTCFCTIVIFHINKTLIYWFQSCWQWCTLKTNPMATFANIQFPVVFSGHAGSIEKSLRKPHFQLIWETMGGSHARVAWFVLLCFFFIWCIFIAWWSVLWLRWLSHRSKANNAPCFENPCSTAGHWICFLLRQINRSHITDACLPFW